MNILKSIAICILALSGIVYGQQPQTHTAPISAINAKYTNGVAPGYAPTNGGGLHVNIGPGTSFCAGVVVQSSSVSISLTANTTNNIYLNTGSSCVPAAKTSAFTSSDIPIAFVTTNGGSITGINDVRNPFIFNPSSGGSTSFSAITSGTNTATLLVSGSLGTTGGGTIAATTAATANTTNTLATPRLLAGNSFNGSANLPFTNKFIVQGTTDSGLTGAQFLGSLTTGLLKNNTTTGVLTIALANTDYLTPNGSATNLSQASTAAYGVVKPDGVTCTITSGLLTCPGSGGISGLTPNVFPVAVSGSSIGDGPCDNGNTTPSIITCTRSFTIPNLTLNDVTKPSQWTFTADGITPVVVAGAAGWGVNSTLSTAGIYLMPDAPCNGLLELSNSSGIVSTSCSTLPWSCQPGFGDGNNAITAATYLQTTCYNDTGKTVTLTGVKCFTDNSGTSTVNITNGSNTALLTGAITCTSSFASGTQSGTGTIASGDFIKLTFVSDGSTKQSSVVITGTHL